MIATRPRRLRRALTTAASVTLLAAPLAACTSHATDVIYQPAIGANATDSDVEVLNAMVISSQDGEGRFIAGLSNTGGETDSITNVTGAGESEAEVQVQVTGGTVEIPPAGFVQLADLGAEQEGPQILVSGEPVKAGYYVRLLIEFERADAVEINVPVVEPGEDLGPYSTALPPESPSEFPSTASLEEDVAE